MIARSLEEQLEAESCQKLRIIQASFESIRIQGRVSSYYVMDISRCIDRGMLLAAIELCTTLIEIWLRDLLVVRKATTDLSINKEQYKRLITKYDREIEGSDKRGLSSHQIISQLAKLNVLNTEEVEWLHSLFNKVRNPLHHGLTGKLVDPEYHSRDLVESAISKEEVLLATIFGNYPEQRLSSFEEFLDREAIGILEEALNFLVNHNLPSGI
ncbi:hypothetical protein [uncultured Paraglaciecola sp.]|uniref:hypothetical protein n=1 Tax=uncultured Paraglaciecola sp. TaxID=1765024 RepID=UPI0025915A56|nr:hypothetical protein [uncultured Paraglaciecola sp.]